jgi:hypothetical protein
LKKKVLALFSVLTLTFSCSFVFVNLVAANPGYFADFPFEPLKTLPSIDVYSPIQNETYYSPHLLLNFTVIKPDSWFNPTSSGVDLVYGNLRSVYYTVDGGEPQNITVNDPYPTDGITNTLPQSNFTFSLTLNLTAGVHSVEIGVEANSYYLGPDWIPLSHIVLQTMSEPINFTVTLAEPVIITPENAVYNESVVPLVFSLGAPASWVGYSLDGKDNVTLSGNTTLTGLSNGWHNVTVYANDTSGNVYSSQTVNFKVAQSSLTASLAATVAISTAAIVVVGGVLAVYFKKRKPSARPNAERQ